MVVNGLILLLMAAASFFSGMHVGRRIRHSDLRLAIGAGLVLVPIALTVTLNRLMFMDDCRGGSCVDPLIYTAFAGFAAWPVVSFGLGILAQALFSRPKT